MDFLNLLWITLLEKPLYNALLFIYNTLPISNMGLALVTMTVILRLFLLPFSFRSAEASRRMQALQPAIANIRKTYDYNIEEQRIKIRELVRKNKINAYGGIVSVVLQAILFVVLYKIFRHDMNPLTSGLTYHFFNVDPRNAIVDTTFFGTFDMIVPNIIVSFVAALIVLIGLLVSWGRSDEEGMVDKWMFFLLPAVTFFGTAFLPSSKAVFIATSVAFSIVLQFFFLLGDTWTKRGAKKNVIKSKPKVKAH